MFASLARVAPIAAPPASSPICVAISSSADIDGGAKRHAAAELAFHVAMETLALMGAPAFAFDATGKLLIANRLIGKLTSHFRLRAHDTISFKDLAVEAQFRKAVAAFGFAQDPPMRAFIAPRSGTHPAMMARVLSIRSMPGCAAAGGAGMLVLTPLAPPEAPPIELMQSLFNLTPAEARVAGSLTAGATLDDIAASGSVSRNTVRSQLREIMAKAGCHRQAEAVGLFSMLSAATKSLETTAFD